MKICLINPITIYQPIIKDDHVTDSQNTLPYLGLGYIAAMLEKNGYEVDIIECTHENMWGEELIEKIQNEKYFMIGISLFDYNVKNGLNLVGKIRDRLSESFIFAGGIYATTEYDLLLKEDNGINCCILAEGEYTTLELIKAVESNGELSEVSGIAYLDNGAVKLTPNRELISNLDEIPFPKRVFSHPAGKIQVKTSRGCENNCIFCATSAVFQKCKGNKLRFRSPSNIIAEILDYELTADKIKRIFFIDDSFLSVRSKQREWLIELCRLMRKNKINVPFDIYARAKGIIKHEDLLEMLKAHGLESIFIGVESFLDNQLKYYNKRTTSAENLMALEILKKYQIDCEIGFIPLDPRITIEEVRENYEILRKSPVVDIGSSFKAFSQNRAVIALNGTPLRNLLISSGKSIDNERGYDFEDERVRAFFKISKLWGWRINNILEKGVLTEWCKLNKKEELLKNTLNVNKKFARHDIDFAINLCSLLIEQIPTKKETTSFMNQYSEINKKIYEEFLEIENEMSNMQV